MQRIFAVSCSPFCKDSFSELLDMTFVDFAAFECLLRIRGLYDEEKEYNKYQMTKN